MKKYYIASICRNGVLGGGIIAGDESITYKTGKVTVPAKLRNLEMNYGEILSYSEKWVLCFPVFSLSMSDDEKYSFIVFAQKSFRELLDEKIGSKRENSL